MNIRYIKSNIAKIPEDNLLRFLYDIILEDLNDIKEYKSGEVYIKGDRVYLQENSKHQIFQCSVDNSSTLFNYDEWDYILEVFERDIDKLYNLKVKEEVHIIDESTKSSIYTNLNFNSSRSTVALYCGKHRYALDYDFTLNGNEIVFNKPFNIGDRVILEVRESVGIEPTVGIILYDLNGLPYKVYIGGKGIIEVRKQSEVNNNDKKYAELVTGDATYTLLVDGGSEPYELKAYKKIETYITGTNNEIYKVEATENEIFLIETNRGDCFSDTKVILGLDKKFYTLSYIDNNIVATEYIDDSLITSNFDMGVKIITRNFKNRLIVVDNGVVKLLPYIDNGGYHNINFIDRITGDVIRLTVNNDNELEMYDGLDTDGDSGTRMLEYFYFFDNEWGYNRMFVENGNLLFETCDPNVIPDSRGINLLKHDGEMVKLKIPSMGEGIHIVKSISLDNMGTFESPIEGFVVNINNETKLVTVNKESDKFEIVDTNLPFRTNHHYVMSVDGRIYKLHIENNIPTFVEYDIDDIDIERVVTGAFIKYNEMIVRFDIVDGDCVFNPISTFVHRIKSDINNAYFVDVVGEPYEETLSFTHIDDVDFNVDVGYGNMYLKDVDGNCYVVNIDDRGNVNFVSNEPLVGVDYDITSLISSSQGWYKIIVDNQNLKLEKLYDNMYENMLSYGNIVKKSFEIQGSSGKWYSLSANGLGEIVVNDVGSTVDVTGLLLRSDDGYNYGLGIIGNTFATYRSYVTNPNVKEKILLKDTVNDNNHVLFMSGDKLCSNTTNESVDATSVIILDAYRNQFKIEMNNNRLLITSL